MRGGPALGGRQPGRSRGTISPLPETASTMSGPSVGGFGFLSEAEPAFDLRKDRGVWHGGRRRSLALDRLKQRFHLIRREVVGLPSARQRTFEDLEPALEADTMARMVRDVGFPSALDLRRIRASKPRDEGQESLPIRV